MVLAAAVPAEAVLREAGRSAHCAGVCLDKVLFKPIIPLSS